VVSVVMLDRKEAMRRRLANIGDIYEIRTSKGMAYCQYTHDGKEMAQLIRVLPGFHQTRPADLLMLAREKELYFIFYTLEYALRSRLIERVGAAPIPQWAIRFPVMRRPGGIRPEGGVINWLIFDGPVPETPGRRRSFLDVRELTADQRELSIEMLVAHPALLKKLENGWTPARSEQIAREEREREAIRPEIAATEASGVSTRHFFYFPKKRDANGAKARLIKEGWNAVLKRSADDQNWLVLASRPSGIEAKGGATIRILESLAMEFHGSYDGWETPIIRPTN
jgi:hypothetical protein